MLPFHEIFPARDNVWHPVTLDICAMLNPAREYWCECVYDDGYKWLGYLGILSGNGYYAWIRDGHIHTIPKRILMRVNKLYGTGLNTYDVEGNNCAERTALVTLTEEYWNKLLTAWAPQTMQAGMCASHSSCFDMLITCRNEMRRRLFAILRRWVDKDSAGIIVGMCMH
jgi:hypothetical protein